MSKEPEATSSAEPFTSSPVALIAVDGVVITTSVLQSGVPVIEAEEL